MYQWMKDLIEGLYAHICTSHRRQRKCKYCGRFLLLLEYYTVKDGREITKFCNADCACNWINFHNRNQASFNEYRRHSVKSEDWIT